MIESNQLKLVGPRVPIHQFFPCCTRNKIEIIPLSSITDIFVAQDSFYFVQEQSSGDAPFLYVSLLTSQGRAYDLVLNSMADYVDFRFALQLKAPHKYNRRYLCLKALKLKLDRIAFSQKLTTHQILLRAIYQTMKQKEMPVDKMIHFFEVTKPLRI